MQLKNLGQALGLAASTLLGALAQQPANTLTPAEVAEGWLLLFDGETPFGWRSRGQAAWEVVEGALGHRPGSGPGFLATTSEFADFELDAEFWVDAVANSGVFFRALPGEFWSGYESQIRNQWEGEDRTRAVDFGTGGLYNRQPARRVVSNDREWFTMAIHARGRHLATWVNGYPVTDFTDTRPPGPNARQGYRAAAGVLSLQGHDPTTDLSFRNLRLVELPPPRF